MDVPAEAWERLVSAGSGRRFRRGDVLLRQGDAAAYVLVLVAGRVKVLRTSPDGDVLLLAVRGPGEVLGDVSVLGGDGRSASVVAVEPCTTRAITAERFRELVREEGLEGSFLRHAMSRLREGEAWRAELAALPAGPRLARALLRFADDAGDVALGQTELGQATGLSRSSVAAELARMRDSGLVSTAHRRVVLGDRPGLHELAESGHGTV
ncbi:Crp/Fnr family transcriptional regulator [Actinomadura sp. WMMB 499]|uniref:Crp/Fnr family transcriptional regulator n=1 Tax=Actinomadura sp. WMMB 499 TaxID=1219491 RepID=UPI0020C76AC4|nr:Crp/Fnr family transcriptional regulator [Actinomadura sp. WMMB 499]